MLKRLLFVAPVLLTIGVAHAGTVVVLPGTTWGTIPNDNSGGGSSAITGTVARNGNGSVEMFGDRTRFTNANYYSPASNLGLLSTVLGLSFDWRVAGNSSGGYSPDLTPALRLHIFDQGVRSELIWEGAYNNTYGNSPRDTWYSTTFNDLFYQNVTGAGVTFSNGAQVNLTVADWLSKYSSSAYVSGISVGVGSGFSSNYHAFADDITFATTNGTTVYDFEVTQAVPEPSTWAMMILGFAGVGFLAYRRKQNSTLLRAT
jgi:hypothetical protein